MARRSRRRGFGFLPGSVKKINPLGKTVKSTDLFLGAFGGLALGAVVKYAINKLHVSLTEKDPKGGLPDFLLAYAGPLSTFLAGVGLYFLSQKSGKFRGKADAFLVGGSLAAAAPIFWTALGKYGPKMKDGVPFFSDYVMSPGYGLLTSDRPAYGLLTADGTRSFAGNEDWDPMSAP